MALTNEQVRNQILTSVHGRRMGLTPPSTRINVGFGGDMLAGPLDIIRTVQDLTSASTGTALNNFGVVNIAGTSLLTSAQGYLLSNPIPGVGLIVNNVRSNATAGSSGSTAINLIRPSTAFYIRSSEASTGVAIQLSEAASITLMGVSTDAYQVIGRTGVGAVVVGAT